MRRTCKATPIGLVDESKVSCTGGRRTETCVAPKREDASRDLYVRGGGCALPDFLFLLCLLSVQLITSGIGHRVKLFFRVGNI